MEVWRDVFPYKQELAYVHFDRPGEHTIQSCLLLPEWNKSETATLGLARNVLAKGVASIRYDDRLGLDTRAISYINGVNNVGEASEIISVTVDKSYFAPDPSPGLLFWMGQGIFGKPAPLRSLCDVKRRWA